MMLFHNIERAIRKGQILIALGKLKQEIAEPSELTFPHSLMRAVELSIRCANIAKAASEPWARPPSKFTIGTSGGNNADRRISLIELNN